VSLKLLWNLVSSTIEVQNDLGIAATITHPAGSTVQPDQGGATGTDSQA